MTAEEFRQLICGNAKRFTLPIHVLKDRIGDPDSIRILHNWCQDTGRDVVLMTYAVENGSMEIFCPIDFNGGVETVFDGWIGAFNSGVPMGAAASTVNLVRGISQLRGLFDDKTSKGTIDKHLNSGEAPSWSKVQQMSFDDLQGTDDVSPASND